MEMAAVFLIKRLLKDGGWYHSAIELSEEDGEELEREARRILRGPNLDTADTGPVLREYELIEMTAERLRRKAEIEARRDQPCSNNWRDGVPLVRPQPHSKPDAAGQCEYCRTVLEPIADIDY